MQIIKNKKAILLPATLKIILAVIGTFLLIYLFVNLYGLLTTKTDIEQAKSSLEGLYSEIQNVDNGKGTRNFLIQSPNDWMIITWPNNNEDSKPIQCKDDNCICICPTTSDENKFLSECNNKGICKDTPKKVKTIENPLLIEGPASLKIELEGKGTENEKITIRSN
ncbi:hypothetical protein CMI40_01365 [Candidatus Pacearchaeota archaeon]|jgi:hypothetical protein|nr:hypothetical protein [Candidatus Pacearchaeota archaeon]|tara:strand:+ start:1363 stop:1860 length:498 start_codon:yes stop_codon:yes gene_type:complete